MCVSLYNHEYDTKAIGLSWCFNQKTIEDTKDTLEDTKAILDG